MSNEILIYPLCIEVAWDTHRTPAVAALGGGGQRYLTLVEAGIPHLQYLLPFLVQ